MAVVTALLSGLGWFSHHPFLRAMDPRRGWLLLVPVITGFLAYRAYESQRENVQLEASLQKLRALEEELKHQAFHDSLTKLANRELFTDRVQHALAARSRAHAPVAVLYLDLDDFKTINDSLGHDAGDSLLVSVAERLATCLRPSDTAARIGGDEFAVLLKDAAAPEVAIRIAERILRAMTTPFLLAGKEVCIHTSVGIAFSAGGKDDTGELLRNADVAMYRAKSEGKGRYAIFAPEMHAVVLQRMEVKAQLQRAMSRGELTLVYQPIVDLLSGDIAAVEALIRWRHPEYGVLAPRDFISVAEETGLILAISRWVLERSCRQVREWQKRWPAATPLKLNVNLSSREVQTPSFVSDVAATLAEADFEPSHLVLELPEGVLMQLEDAALEKLDELRGMGIQLALDDFGTGYLSPSRFKNLPVDIVKIDKYFIDSVGRGTEEESDLALAIIRLAGALRMKVVAEGIEVAQQWHRLRELSCVMGQGYYFAKPLEASAIEALLEGHATRCGGAPSTEDTVLSAGR
ncbi:MAG: putative bifunctional diguanylate cyclase/phosphodiesterase [Actinomycetota bacterium]